MVVACDISTKRAGLSSQERDDVVALLKRFQLPKRNCLLKSIEKG